MQDNSLPQKLAIAVCHARSVAQAIADIEAQEVQFTPESLQRLRLTHTGIAMALEALEGGNELNALIELGEQQMGGSVPF